MDYGIFSTVTYTLISDDAETPYSMHSFDPPPELAGIVADLLEGFERIVQDPLALPVDPLPELVQAYETRLKTSPPHRGPSVDSMYSQVIAHHILDQVREVQELLTWTETSVDPMALAVIWGELTQDVRDARVRAMVRTYRLMRERSTAKDACERVLGMMEHICWRIDLRAAEVQRKAPARFAAEALRVAQVRRAATAARVIEPRHAAGPKRDAENLCIAERQRKTNARCEVLVLRAAEVLRKADARIKAQDFRKAEAERKVEERMIAQAARRVASTFASWAKAPR